MFVLRFYPCHQYGYGILLFFLGEFSSGGYVMPFVEASSATAAGGVLGEEHWMASHWCLLAVIWDDRRCKPRLDEIGSMTLNGSHALVHYVLPVLFAQMKLCAESGFLQAQKRLLNG